MVNDPRDQPRTRAISLGLNYPVLPDRCRRVELALFVDIAEVLVYDRVLSQSERQDVEQHLSAKYGL